jgi:hypothetical protein
MCEARRVSMRAYSESHGEVGLSKSGEHSVGGGMYIEKHKSYIYIWGDLPKKLKNQVRDGEDVQ